MSKIDEALKPLRDLYRITGEDWNLRVHISVTEPTCPTAIIYPDGWALSRYRCDGDTIETAIIGAASMVFNEIVLRQQATLVEGYSEGDDELYAEWVKARIEGCDNPLPEKN